MDHTDIHPTARPLPAATPIPPAALPRRPLPRPPCAQPQQQQEQEAQSQQPQQPVAAPGTRSGPTGLNVKGKYRPTSPGGWAEMSSTLREAGLRLVAPQEVPWQKEKGAVLVDIRPAESYQEVGVRGWRAGCVCAGRSVYGAQAGSQLRRGVIAVVGLYGSWLAARQVTRTGLSWPNLHGTMLKECVAGALARCLAAFAGPRARLCQRPLLPANPGLVSGCVSGCACPGMGLVTRRTE